MTALAAAPATVLGRPRVTDGAAGEVAWGDPAIVARCGLAALGPSPLPCLAVDGLDWVVDTGADPMTAVSFGRAPAVEVRMPHAYSPPDLAAALVDVAPVAAALPGNGHSCS